MHNDSGLNKIELKKVSKTYLPERGSVVCDVSFDVKEKEFVCIVGPSGCGKTTVLKMIAGIEEPSLGDIVKPQSISMVFQLGALFPWLSVFDNVAMGLRTKNFPKSVIASHVKTYLEMTKMTAYESFYPSALSGGQKQRVGIARALAINPEVLLLDEPFSALDPKTTADLHEDLLEIWQKTGKTIVMVSHSIEEAVSLADRVILMKSGSIVKTYKIEMPYPRREQALGFSRDTLEIRKDFFS